MTVLKTTELIKIAIKDEWTGMAFYKALAANAKNEKIQQGLLTIAEQERLHAGTFEEMLEHVKDFKPNEEYMGQYEGYVSALLENRAFPNSEKAVEKAKSVSTQEGLEIAMRMEKDTLLLYEELVEFLPKTNQSYLDNIMEEERNHLIDLLRLKNIL